MPSHVVALDVVALRADIVASGPSRNQFAALTTQLPAFRLGIEIAWIKLSVGRPALVHQPGDDTTARPRQQSESH